jgi:hypothetical protein
VDALVLAAASTERRSLSAYRLFGAVLERSLRKLIEADTLERGGKSGLRVD